MNFLEAFEELSILQEGTAHAKSLHPIFSFENTGGVCPGCGDQFSEESYKGHLANCKKFKQIVRPRVARIAAVTGKGEGDILRNISNENLLLYRDTHTTCEICGVKIDEKAKKIDHDHDTKNFRGILCNYCNSALGFINFYKENTDAINAYCSGYSTKISEFNDRHQHENQLFIDLNKDSIDDAQAAVILDKGILKKILKAKLNLGNKT